MLGDMARLPSESGVGPDRGVYTGRDGRIWLAANILGVISTRKVVREQISDQILINAGRWVTGLLVKM